MTRVVVDARLSGNSGIGRYIDCLLREFELRHLDLDFELMLAPRTSRIGRTARIHRIGLAPYSKLWQLVAPFQAPRAPVFWTPHWNHPLLAQPGAINVVTIHDVMPLRFSDLYPPMERAIFRQFIKVAVRRRYQIITVSEFSAQELLYFFPTANVEVIKNGIVQLPRGAADVRSPFFLCVGNVKPHKNLPFTIRSFRLAKARGLIDPSVILVVAGAIAGLRTVDRALLSAEYTGADIHFVVSPTDEQLGALYSNCIGLIAASLYEGFGLPLVEAMSCNKTIVCSDIPAFREVAGNQGHYFDPHDSEHFASALADAYAGRDQPPDYTTAMKIFSWAASADAHITLFTRLAQQAESKS